METVKVNWTDSYLYAEQRDESFEFPPAEVETVGILVKEDEEKIVVARDYFVGDEKPYRDSICIPKSCVRKIIKLCENN